MDDEEPARSLLREYLGRAGGVEVVGECRNGFEAVKAVHDLAPDLLFLDIQMPKLNGFEVLELLGRDVAVVFATAFDEHAIRAFEVNAVDYILKPASPERVAAALERARQRLAARAPMPVAELAAAARPAGQPASRIVVRQGPKVHVIAADKLDFAEAQDDYVSLRSEGKSYLKQQTLGDLESSLDPKRFVRIHRSLPAEPRPPLPHRHRGRRAEGGRPRRRDAPAAQPLRLRPAQGAALAPGACVTSRQQAVRHRRVQEAQADPWHPVRADGDAGHLGAAAELAALLLDGQERSPRDREARRAHGRDPRPQVLDRRVLFLRDAARRVLGLEAQPQGRPGPGLSHDVLARHQEEPGGKRVGAARGVPAEEEDAHPQGLRRRAGCAGRARRSGRTSR